MAKHLVPLAIGLLFGAITAAALQRTGVGRERGAWTVLLCAIAVFYPVFAVENGEGADLAVHSIIALVFVGLAVAGYGGVANVIAIGLVAHGVFDLAVVAMPSSSTLSRTAPEWWPAFCAGIDIVLGGVLALTAGQSAKST